MRLRKGWGGETWDSPKRAGAIQEEGGEVFQGVGGLRGKITEFSDASRRRLQRAIQALPLGRLQSRYYIVFGGLTYPKDYPTAQASKEDFEVLRERLRRRYGGQVFGYYKLEPQKRGAPHFHFIFLVPKDCTMPRYGEQWHETESGEVVVDMPAEVVQFDTWLRGAWYEIVGSGDYNHLIHGAYCEVVKSPERVACYVAKYLGKPQDVDGEDLTWREPGRFWGIVGREVLVGYLTGEIYVVSEAVYTLIRRCLRRFGIKRARAAALRRKADGKSGDWRRAAAMWMRHAAGPGTWNTYDPGGGTGAGLVASLLAAYGYIHVVKCKGVFMR